MPGQVSAPVLGGAAATASPSPTADADSRRRRSQFTVMLGLFVTFGGLFGYGLQIPTTPGLLSSVVPWIAIGFITTWLGGIFAGNALNSPPPGVPPALMSQPTVAGLATIAGVLSAVVVVQRVGYQIALSPGSPEELVVAVVAAALTWAGGFLMGHSMQRFVRRRRRAHAR